MAGLMERFRRWRAREAEKLRGMTLPKKIGYVLTYYKGWFLGLLVLALFTGYAVDVVVQNQKETVLLGFFTNDQQDYFPAGRLQRDIADYLELGKDQRVIFDDDLYVDLHGEAVEYTAASNGKIIAYMATQELDFIVSPRAVFDYYSNDVPMSDLKTLLAPDLYERLEPYMIEGVDSEGKPCYTGIDMTESRYISGSENAEYAEQTYVMFVPYSAPHREMLNRYIGFCFDD